MGEVVVGKIRKQKASKLIQMVKTQKKSVLDSCQTAEQRKLNTR